MIEPYMAVGLVTTVWGARTRDDIKRNIHHIHGVMKAALWLSSLDFPVCYVAVPEGALQGFTDEVFDADHSTFARESAIEIPGPETDLLGEIAQEFGVYLVAQAKATDSDEGSYPENARALAMNGAEVIYRPSYPHPATGNEFFWVKPWSQREESR